MSDEHRVKIQNSNILNALVEHVEGKREMTATQVSAGVALLKKVMPDLTSVDATVDLKGEMTITTKEQRDAAVAAATRADR